MLFQRLFFGKFEFVAHIKILESNDICSCPVLRYSVITGVCNNVSYVIISLGQFVVNTVKCFSVVVFRKVCNILKKNYFRFLFVRKSHYFKEQIASLIFKAFLISAHRKGLTRKAGSQNVEIGDGRSLDFSYIVFGQYRVGEIMSICFTGIFIYFICPNNFKSRLCKR